MTTDGGQAGGETSPGSCDGTIGAETVDTVVVPAGATCTLQGTTVTGNVRVQRDGTPRPRLASAVMFVRELERSVRFLGRSVRRAAASKPSDPERLQYAAAAALVAGCRHPSFSNPVHRLPVGRLVEES